jgi:hypothetical protein
VIGVLQPLENDGSIQTAGVGEDNFFDIAHCYFLCLKYLKIYDLHTRSCRINC